MKNSYNIGLTLSGGGARAFGHVGVLKSLEEAGMIPDVISGGSTGAVVALLYADGHSPHEILEILKEESMVHLFQPKFSINSLFQDSAYIDKLKSHFISSTFEDLKLPAYISTVDFLKGNLRFFNSGDIFKPLEASLAIPVLFKPVEIENSLFCDGGALSNLPVEPIKDKCELLIGSNVNPLRPVESAGNVYNVAERTLRVVLFSNMQGNIPLCDLFIEPDKLSDYTLLDFDKADEIFRIGYEGGKAKIDSWFEMKERLSR